MPTLLWIKALLLMVICSVTVNALQNHLHKQDKNLCNYTEWKLVNTTKKPYGVLKKGTGEEKVVEVEIDGESYLNKSFVDEDCCEGFERRGKREKCKPCKHKTYGRNCSKVCNCDGCKKCNHKTGKCDKCEDPTSVSALTKTTTLAPSTYCDIYSTTLEKDEDYTFTCVCRICRRFKNCTTSDTKRCRRRYNLNRTGGHNDSGDFPIILTAVISLLGTITVLRAIGFVLRERHHRMKKQRLQGTGPVKFSALKERHEYPEPVYQETPTGM